MPYGITQGYPAVVRIPPLPPAEAGTRFSDPGGMQGRVDLCYVKADRPRIEPVKRKSNALQLSHHASVYTSVGFTNVRPSLFTFCFYFALFSKRPSVRATMNDDAGKCPEEPEHVSAAADRPARRCTQIRTVKVINW